MPHRSDAAPRAGHVTNDGSRCTALAEAAFCAGIGGIELVPIHRVHVMPGARSADSFIAMPN